MDTARKISDLKLGDSKGEVIMNTKPELFIVESLTFDDEENKRFEGKTLSEILQLSGKSPRYYYVRTEIELRAVLRLFQKSRYRYLHFSCHADNRSVATTLDEINFRNLATLINPHLAARRLFMSACDVVNRRLAREIMNNSGCLSIIGPSSNVNFDEAAIMWASFYFLAFRQDSEYMKGKELRSILRDLTKQFQVPMAYCARNSNFKQGYFFTVFKDRSALLPGKEKQIIV